MTSPKYSVLQGNISVSFDEAILFLLHGGLHLVVDVLSWVLWLSMVFDVFYIFADYIVGLRSAVRGTFGSAFEMSVGCCSVGWGCVVLCYDTGAPALPHPVTWDGGFGSCCVCSDGLWCWLIMFILYLGWGYSISLGHVAPL